MALVQGNSQQPSNLSSLKAAQASHRRKVWILFFSKMHFHHGYVGKTKQLTPKGRDAQDAGGCCGEKGQMAIPCELAQPHSQPSHQIPAEG